ncbi:acyl-CoA thioesterase [Paracoccus aminophilus]|uniref:Thioesterase n=1 Tax=Paracoccus aminophilus JCM 7686 TaxID=1367847 RepID=S5YZ78_PARAH|nr:thioesterase family protein [Paracoccus aminophilus]AGT10506.1 thioesterase [Paracoccus aminophilus JCM 7686]
MPRAPALPRQAFAHFNSHQTRWNDNDQFGHLYNVVYFELFDNAMNNWLIERGMLDPNGPDPIPVVAEAGCSYLREVSYPDIVEIGMRITHMGRSSFKIGLGMFRQGEDQAAAQAEFTLVFVTPNGHKPCPPPDHYRAELEKLVVPEAG